MPSPSDNPESTAGPAPQSPQAMPLVAALVGALALGAALGYGAAHLTGAGAAAPALDDDLARLSYIMGFTPSSNITDSPMDINQAAYMAGIRDGLDGADSRVSQEDAEAATASVIADIEAREKAEQEQLAERNEAESREFLEQNGKRDGWTTTASGLQYSIHQSGAGARPGADSTVRVHYSGTLIDGTEFDSSYERGEPAEFGLGQVIPGWTEALQLMPVGSTWDIVIPSELGYGPSGTPGGPIGPNQVLQFRVELLAIVEPEGDDGAAEQ